MRLTTRQCALAPSRTRSKSILELTRISCRMRAHSAGQQLLANLREFGERKVTPRHFRQAHAASGDGTSHRGYRRTSGRHPRNRSAFACIGDAQ